MRQKEGTATFLFSAESHLCSLHCLLALCNLSLPKEAWAKVEFRSFPDLNESTTELKWERGPLLPDLDHACPVHMPKSKNPFQAKTEVTHESGQFCSHSAGWIWDPPCDLNSTRILFRHLRGFIYDLTDNDYYGSELSPAVRGALSSTMHIHLFEMHEVWQSGHIVCERMHSLAEVSVWSGGRAGINFIWGNRSMCLQRRE